MRMRIDGLGRAEGTSARRLRSLGPAAGGLPDVPLGPAAITAISPAARALAERPPQDDAEPRGVFVADGREVALDMKHSASGDDKDILVSTDGGASFTRVGVDDDATSASLGKLTASTAPRGGERRDLSLEAAARLYGTLRSAVRARPIARPRSELLARDAEDPERADDGRDAP
jgi:hypothetical protein